jgi:hypothetical protein
MSLQSDIADYLAEPAGMLHDTENDKYWLLVYCRVIVRIQTVRLSLYHEIPKNH